MGIQWSTPPAPREGMAPRGYRKYGEFLDELKKHPTRWAVFPGPGNTVHNVATQAKTDGRGIFQATARTTTSGGEKQTVGYLRYMGPVVKAAAEQQPGDRAGYDDPPGG